MDSSLDWFLAIILAVVSVTFFLGKGDGLLQMFDGKRGNNRKNWSEEKVLKYKRALAVFTGCLAIAEFLLALLAAVYPAVVLPEKLLEEGLYEKKVFERIFGL